MKGSPFTSFRRLATTADTILAIDLGRFKSVACVYSRSTRNHAFPTIDSKPDALAHLLAEHPGSLVAIEACANAGWVHDRAVAAGHIGSGHRSLRSDCEPSSGFAKRTRSALFRGLLVGLNLGHPHRRTERDQVIAGVEVVGRADGLLAVREPATLDAHLP